MNCIQAQAMLAEYRELKSAPIGPIGTGDLEGRPYQAGRKEYEEADILELDAHLEECASCRLALARYNFIGEQLRSMTVIEPPPEMHTSLMHALAKEQLHFIQRSAPGTVATPEFLRPYLQEHTRFTPIPDSFSAFSTAETGPLPIIHAKRKRHPHSHINQFAILGIAAMFLMLLMMGGIISLLLLAHGNVQVASTVNRSGQVLVNGQSDLTPLKYTATALYSHVVSAIADNNDIYYTAYSDGDDNGWMLARLDRITRQSTNLLTKASTNPLVVLGAANGWLVWLQYDNLKSTVRQNQTHTGIYSSLHAWSLHYLAITSQSTTTNAKPAAPATLLSGIFNRNTAPSWISTPVQGVWFVQNSLLVAMIDVNGSSHLLRYQLGTGSSPSTSMIEIAKAPVGKILTSPTANNDGSDIFWAEEWLSADGNLHSNIWVQRVIDVQKQFRGKVLENTAQVQEVYRSDQLSFRPQVVDDTLFLLSASKGTISTQGVPVPATTFNFASVPRIDTSVYAEPLDNFVPGTIVMIPLDGYSIGIPTMLGTVDQSSALQAGNHFALWQDNDTYKMYDVQTMSDVTVGQVLNGANFVAVNGDTTVWTVDTGNTTPTPGLGPVVTLMAFNWTK